MADLNFIDTLLACPGCKFDPNDPVTIAANAAVGVMIMTIFGVFAGFAALIWKLAKGERLAQNPDSVGSQD